MARLQSVEPRLMQPQSRRRNRPYDARASLNKADSDDCKLDAAGAYAVVAFVLG